MRSWQSRVRAILLDGRACCSEEIQAVRRVARVPVQVRNAGCAATAADLPRLDQRQKSLRSDGLALDVHVVVACRVGDIDTTADDRGKHRRTAADDNIISRPLHGIGSELGPPGVEQQPRGTVVDEEIVGDAKFFRERSSECFGDERQGAEQPDPRANAFAASTSPHRGCRRAPEFDIRHRIHVRNTRHTQRGSPGLVLARACLANGTSRKIDMSHKSTSSSR